MLFSGKIPLCSFFFIFSTLISTSSISAQEAKPTNSGDLIKINEKIDQLSDRMDQLESNAVDVHEIITNITRAVISANHENSQKLEEKLNKMAAKVSASEGGVSEWCHSTCRDRVATWAKATDTSLDHINRCLTTQQTTTEPPPATVTTTTTSPIIVCHPNKNPCLHGGRCQPNSTGSGYECACSNFTSGSRCQNVECTVEKRCWRLNDTLYTVIETKLRWEEAKVACESLNMTLAMPKDEERTRFLWDHLKPLYGAQQYLWLGLRYDKEANGWFWVDGSALGEYTGGRAEMRSEIGPYSGILWLVSVDGPLWWWAFPHEVYSICETQLISL